MSQKAQASTMDVPPIVVDNVVVKTLGVDALNVAQMHISSITVSVPDGTVTMLRVLAVVWLAVGIGSLISMALSIFGALVAKHNMRAQSSWMRHKRRAPLIVHPDRATSRRDAHTSVDGAAAGFSPAAGADDLDSEGGIYTANPVRVHQAGDMYTAMSGDGMLSPVVE
jgi:hypothetical protein